MIRVYLAARYSRREELCRYREQLQELGFDVQARWLDGSHELDGRGLSVEAKVDERTRFALEDWEDVTKADWVISFTEIPRSTPGRGGRHVEFGAAMALERRCIVIGPRENVFHHLPRTEHLGDWEAFLETTKHQIDSGWWPVGDLDEEAEEDATDMEPVVE